MKNEKIKITKEKIILFFVLFIISCLLYHNFITGFFSVDAINYFTRLGYKDYSINYSFYDGRIIMGTICLIANFLNYKYKVFYIIMLIMALIVSTITIIKIIKIIKEKKKPNSKIEYILLIIISYNYTINFMTIDNMQWAECFVMALSVLFYILSAEKLIIKNEIKKGIIYCIIATFCYQGTVNMFIITTILFTMLEDKIWNKKTINKLLSAIGVLLLATILNIVFIKILGCYIYSEHAERTSLQLYQNFNKNCQKILFLIWNNLDLFPAGCFIGFIIATFILTYIYAIKNKKIQIYYTTLILFSMTIISSVLLWFVFPDGVIRSYGRIYGSIGASFSILWTYLYIKTDIINTKIIYKYCSIIIVIIYSLLNIYNILIVTYESKQNNLIDEELAKKIEQKIIQYENENNKIKYIVINIDGLYDEKSKERSVNISLKKNKLFSENTIKAYIETDFNVESIPLVEAKERMKEKSIVLKEEIECIDDTIYVTI